LLAATRVDLLVLGKVDLTEDQRGLWRDWEPKGKRLLHRHGIALGPTVFTTPEACSAALYRNAVPLRIASLGPTPWY
jgi:hypothetical protein